jgi:hypothetical protein
LVAVVCRLLVVVRLLLFLVVVVATLTDNYNCNND